MHLCSVGNALGTARTFDLTIETKSGHSHTFNAVNRDEHEMMDTYLKSKKVRVTNQMADDVLNDLIGDDDDEEMQSVHSSGSEEPTVRRGADVDDEDSEEGNNVVQKEVFCHLMSFHRRRLQSIIK